MGGKFVTVLLHSYYYGMIASSKLYLQQKCMGIPPPYICFENCDRAPRLVSVVIFKQILLKQVQIHTLWNLPRSDVVPDCKGRKQSGGWGWGVPNHTSYLIFLAIHTLRNISRLFCLTWSHAYLPNSPLISPTTPLQLQFLPVKFLETIGSYATWRQKSTLLIVQKSQFGVDGR